MTVLPAGVPDRGIIQVNERTKVKIHSTGEGFGLLVVEQGSKVIKIEMPVDFMRAFAGSLHKVSVREGTIITKKLGEIVVKNLLNLGVDIVST